MLTCSFVIPGSQCLISGLWHGTDEEIPWRLKWKRNLDVGKERFYSNRVSQQGEHSEAKVYLPLSQRLGRKDSCPERNKLGLKEMGVGERDEQMTGSDCWPNNVFSWGQSVLRRPPLRRNCFQLQYFLKFKDEPRSKDLLGEKKTD